MDHSNTIRSPVAGSSIPFYTLWTSMIHSFLRVPRRIRVYSFNSPLCTLFLPYNISKPLSDELRKSTGEECTIGGGQLDKSLCMLPNLDERDTIFRRLELTTIVQRHSNTCFLKLPQTVTSRKRMNIIQYKCLNT